MPPEHRAPRIPCHHYFPRFCNKKPNIGPPQYPAPPPPQYRAILLYPRGTVLRLLQYIYILYQSQNLTVASARNWRVCRQGRRGQGSRRQGRGRHGRTGQGRGTYQKRTEQKQSRAWAKSKAGHNGHCAI